eukprot:5290508-Amphidinium_carterae.1
MGRHYAPDNTGTRLTVHPIHCRCAGREHPVHERDNRAHGSSYGLSHMMCSQHDSLDVKDSRDRELHGAVFGVGTTVVNCVRCGGRTSQHVFYCCCIAQIQRGPGLS